MKPASRRNALREMPYREYLRTPEWLAFKAKRIKAARWRCQVCNLGGVELHVHHRTYERRGHEATHDVVVLCRTCHRLFHEHRRLARQEG